MSRDKCPLIIHLSPKGSSNKDVKLTTSKKVNMLNPNAAEFVPSAHRSAIRNTKNADQSRLEVPGPSGKAVQDRPESGVSNNSDDEASQYWSHQLPDDITPDFKVMREDELQISEHISLAALSIHDGIEASRCSAPPTRQLMGPGQDVSVSGLDNLNLTRKTIYSGTASAEDRLSAVLMASVYHNNGEQFINSGNQFLEGGESHLYNADSRNVLSDTLLSELNFVEDTTSNALEFLASSYPAFTDNQLADLYYANGGRLNSTVDNVEMLTNQLEPGYVKLSRNPSSKALTSPSFSMFGFPASPVAEVRDGENLQQALNSYKSPSSLSRGSMNFSSTIREHATQDSDRWQYDRNSSTDGCFGSRNPRPLTNSANLSVKSFLRDNVQNFGAKKIPAWFGTGETVDSREEAHDFSRLRNTFLEQPMQVYPIENIALEKELSTKGSLYGMQMRNLGKARETIYRQRNPVVPEIPHIDLHGLRVNDAIDVITQKLGILIRKASSTGQQQQVIISMGTSHYAREIRSLANLPLAIEQYLLKQGFNYTQPHPGLLHVVIY